MQFRCPRWKMTECDNVFGHGSRRWLGSHTGGVLVLQPKITFDRILSISEIKDDYLTTWKLLWPMSTNQPKWSIKWHSDQRQTQTTERVCTLINTCLRLFLQNWNLKLTSFSSLVCSASTVSVSSSSLELLHTHKCHYCKDSVLVRLPCFSLPL